MLQTLVDMDLYFVATSSNEMQTTHHFMNANIKKLFKWSMIYTSGGKKYTTRNENAIYEVMFYKAIKV